MKLVELLNRANQGYPDGQLETYYDENGAPNAAGERLCGDTLALFIVRELRETFDATASDQKQLAEAEKQLKRAIMDIRDVIKKL